MKHLTFKNLITGVVFLLLLLLFKDWIKPAIITALGGYTVKQTIVKEKIDIKTDTVFMPSKPIVIEGKIPVRTELTLSAYTALLEKYDKRLKELSKLPVAKDSIYVYKTDVSDTLITGAITSYVDGKSANILGQYLTYKPLFPKYITKTVTVTKEIENTLNNTRPKIGVGLGINTIETVAVKAAYQTVNGWQFQVGYNKAINSELVHRNTTVNNYYELGIFKLF